MAVNGHIVLVALRFLHDTGVRPGEAAALTWARVRLEDHEADIVASYSPAAARDTDNKTHQERPIELADLVVETLTACWQDQRKETLKAGRKPRVRVHQQDRIPDAPGRQLAAGVSSHL